LWAEHQNIRRNTTIEEEDDDEEEDGAEEKVNVEEIIEEEENQSVNASSANNDENSDAGRENVSVSDAGRENDGNEITLRRSTRNNRGVPCTRLINAIDNGKTYIDMGVLSMENIMEETALVSAVNSSNPDEPYKFKEAWHHPDTQERGKRREAIRKEFRDMTNRGVWKKIK